MATADFNTLMEYFGNEDKARELFEEVRWPDGPVCPHCGSLKSYKLEAKPDSKKPVRKGVYKCGDCRKQYTVTVGTIFERSRIPLNKWFFAINMMCASKKGVSAHQLHRQLGITYKSAWFMCHRIRETMEQGPLAELLGGIIEVDETYIGGKPRKENKPRGSDKEPKKHKRGRGAENKTPVVAIVQRNGISRAKKITTLTGKNLRKFAKEYVSKDASVMTDEYKGYLGFGKEFASHETVAHSKGEFARGKVHVNTAESWFSLLERGIMGAFHHISDKHLDRYANEFVFRWDRRKTDDLSRTFAAIKASKGKRLQYRWLIQGK